MHEPFLALKDAFRVPDVRYPAYGGMGGEGA